jgi:D-amino-acid dehydrogenase
MARIQRKSGRVVVVGGGIVGLCAAYYLGRRGCRVTVLERGSLAESASAGNAGIVAIGHGPMPRPGLGRKALRWMLDRESPLYIQPAFRWDLARWLLGFQKACRPAHLRACMEILAQLGRETVRCWKQIVETEKIDCHYRRGGWLDVYKSRQGRSEVEAEALLVGGHGFRVESLSGDELRGRDPGFGDEIQGAVCYVDSVFLDPDRFVAELAACLPAVGIEIREEAPVSHLIVRDGRCLGVQLAGQDRLEADRVVLAAGVWTTRLAAAVGVNVPMQAGKGYHLDLTRPERCIETACVLNEKFVAVNPLPDRLRLAGTVELSGINQRLLSRRLEMLKVAAAAYLRGIDQTTEISRWCGLRPCTADGLPVVGWAPDVENLFIATGHAKMGLTHGPITGRLVSEFLLDGQPSLDVTPLRVERF